jgi:tetratricopeptide (TPR) repeat protein
VPAGSATYMRPLAKREVVAVYIYNIANSLRDTGRVDDAVSLYELAATVLPGFVECHGNLGVEYTKAGRIEEAIREFRAAITADPGQSGAHLNLAAALRQSGREDEAVAALRAGLQSAYDSKALEDALKLLAPDRQ